MAWTNSEQDMITEALLHRAEELTAELIEVQHKLMDRLDELLAQDGWTAFRNDMPMPLLPIQVLACKNKEEGTGVIRSEDRALKLNAPMEEMPTHWKYTEVQ